jgi:SAM-dependent methyltransferase
MSRQRESADGASRVIPRVEGGEAVWHDVECGAYAADLPLWEALADGHGPPVVELGAGTGRVALHLARQGHEVWAVEADAGLAGELRERAGELPVHPVVADARELELDRAFPLILAPMQLLHLLGGSPGRRRLLDRAAAHLSPGGLLAVAVVEGVPADSLAGDAGAPPLPDVLERDGWVYSSLPLGAGIADGRLEVRRLRQAVSPAGELSESEHVDRLDILTADEVEAEAREAGLVPAGRDAIAGGVAHVGSSVLLLERP